MKKKIKVYYTVQYVKEVELEVNEIAERVFKTDKELNSLDGFFYDFQELNEKDLEVLPIAELYRDDNGDILLVDYIEDSFEIDYFTE